MGVCTSRQGAAQAPSFVSVPFANHEVARVASQLGTAALIEDRAPEPTPTPHETGPTLCECPSKPDQQMSRTSSPCSTNLSVGGEGPFTGYNPRAWYNTTSSVTWAKDDDPLQGNQGSPSHEPPPHAVPHRKSASISVLERISRERQSRSSISINRSDDYMPQSRDTEVSAISTRNSLSARTRRLSSKFNDIPIQLGRFLERQEEEPMVHYLRRIFEAVDTRKEGTVAIREIVRRVFPDSEHESIETTLSAATRTAEGSLTADQFVSFFAHLSESNCLGPEFDLDVGGSGEEMGLSATSNPSVVDGAAVSAVDTPGELSNGEQALSASAKLISGGPTEVCEGEQKWPRHLRDVRVRSLTGQSERIKCLAMSADPRLYAVSHRHDCVAHIYTNQGKEVRRLTGHGDSLLGIAFSPDRKYIATVSRDKLLVVWDCTVGLECHSVEHPGIVTAVAFAFDGKHVFTGCQDNITRKLSFPKGRLRATIPELPNAESGVIVSVATQHTRNGLVVFSRSCDEHAYVAQAANLSLCMQLNGHETLVWQTAFSSNDDYILTCCERKVIVWRTEDFSPVGDYDASLACPLASSAVVDACLWTTAIFGPLMYKNLIFAFNTHSEMLVLDLESPDDGVAMDMRLRSSVYAAATSDMSNCLVCGDDLGNVYQLVMN